MQALAGRAAEFIFRDTQPTAMFGRIAEVEAANVLPRLRRKRFVKRAGSVRVQIVANQRDVITAGVPPILSIHTNSVVLKLIVDYIPED
jgi:hypothetical protein